VREGESNPQPPTQQSERKEAQAARVRNKQFLGRKTTNGQSPCVAKNKKPIVGKSAAGSE